MPAPPLHEPTASPLPGAHTEVETALANHAQYPQYPHHQAVS